MNETGVKKEKMKFCNLRFESLAAIVRQPAEGGRQHRQFMIGFLKKKSSRLLDMDYFYRLARVCCLCGLLGLGLGPARAETGQTKKIICEYALTSANDFPQRDPQDWQLMGSNDQGKTWTILDIRKGEVFQTRQQRKPYKIENQTAFEIYRLQIDKIRDPNAANSVQLAEIELMGPAENDFGPVPTFTDTVSAQGDYPPAEPVLNLFDGRAETKWLDWPTNSSTRASWVQWQYSAPVETMVTNIGKLLALHARAGDGYRVQIEAVVAGRVANGKQVCFVDATGCIELGEIRGAETLVTNQTVLITGISRWNGQQVGLKDGGVRALDLMFETNSGRHVPQPSSSQEKNLKWVELEGEIQYQRSTENEFSFDLKNDALSSVRVHLRCPEKFHALPASGTRVLVRGICAGAFDESGRWGAANLWAAGWASLSILNPQTRNYAARTPLIQTNQIPTNSTTLTTIEQVRELTPIQIDSHTHVKVRGIVTELHGEFIQDDTAGIRIVFSDEKIRKFARLGNYIEVDGVAGTSENENPLMLVDHITILGIGKLPEPQRVSISRLMSGRIDAQWTEVQGMVRSTDGSHLLIISEGRELMATLGLAGTDLVNGLVDAEIRARGVAVTARDDQGRIQGVHLLIPSLEHVEVVESPHDAATIPVRKISSLLGLNGLGESFHRVKVEGVVTLQENQKVFLQDKTGSVMAILKEDVELDARFGRSRWLYWQTSQPQAGSKSTVAFHPGDLVQAVGFPETHRYSPVLSEVILTKLGTRQPVEPVEITTNDMKQGGLDSRLVTFRGILRGQTTIGANTVLAMEWEDRTLQALVPDKESDFFKTLIGSRLRITGVWQVDPPLYPELGLVAGAVRILTRSPADVMVLTRPPWWTVRRALMLIGGMTFIILGSIIWIRELRRKVGERTMQLAAQIQLREQTERHHALEQERARIAKDLHDDLGANLTQIVFLSDRVKVARQDGQEVTRWFDLIPATARRTIQSLDEIVWAINPQHDSLESLANYLSQFAQEYLTLAGMRCVLDVPMVLPTVPLSAEVRHNLLLTTREALQNSVKHAAATEVQLTLKFNEDGLTIKISDNGKGFNPDLISAEGNGLQNMQQRVQGIGGQLDISSHLGQGTVVFLHVTKELLHGRIAGRNELPGEKL